MKTTLFFRRARRLAGLGALLALVGLSVASADRSRVSFSVGVNIPAGGHEFRHGPDRYYAYRGQYYRWDRGAYYRAGPPRGYYVDRLPRNYTRVYVGNNVYYRADHVYYRPYGTRYEIVEVPVPVEVERRTVVTRAQDEIGASAPQRTALVEVWLDDQRYLLDNGQYFKNGPNGRIWVKTPVGATIRTLPIGAISVWHEDNEYFEFAALPTATRSWKPRGATTSAEVAGRR